MRLNIFTSPQVMGLRQNPFMQACRSQKQFGKKYINKNEEDVKITHGYKTMSMHYAIETSNGYWTPLSNS